MQSHEVRKRRSRGFRHSGVSFRVGGRIVLNGLENGRF